MEGDRFPFHAGSAVLPEAAELVERSNHLVDELHQRMSELETQLLEERAAREEAEADKVRAEGDKARAKERMRELEAEPARLKGRGWAEKPSGNGLPTSPAGSGAAHPNRPRRRGPTPA